MLLVFFLCAFFSTFASNETEQKIEFLIKISKIKEQGLCVFEQNNWMITPWHDLIKNYVRCRYATKEKDLILHLHILQYQEIRNYIEQLLQNIELVYFIFTISIEQNNNELVNNLVTTIPISHYNKIEGLDISESNISTLPELISNFRNLKFISIQKNKIITLPDWLRNMNKIEMFLASENQINSIENVSFENIAYLDIYKNQINTIEFPIIPTLKYCDLRQNPLNADITIIKHENMPGIQTLHMPLSIKQEFLKGFEDFYEISEGQSRTLKKLESHEENNPVQLDQFNINIDINN